MAVIGNRACILIGLALLWQVAPMTPPAPAADATTAYIERGRQTEARQRAYHQRMERLREALAEVLARSAPDLLARLEPTPPTVFGYALLPRIVPDPPPSPAVKPQVVRFSWAWSDTLIARESALLDRLEGSLAEVAAVPAPRAALQALVADYKARVDRRRPIDADIDYNWLWQKRIAEQRPLFDRLQRALDAEVARQAGSDATAAGQAAPAIGFDPAPYLRFEQAGEHEHIVTVPLTTDITDAALVAAFVAAVEGNWRARAGEVSYRVRLEVTTLTPERLYCAPAAEPEAACAVPAVGDKINLPLHVKRFPKGGAILTTGAASLQLVGAALVLGPHDISVKTLAHELGHLLGFPDAYLRGYRDLGADGFQVLELVADRADIMSSIASGTVLPQHFERLIAARAIQGEMQAGMAALYRQDDAAAAVARFRAVLARNPSHFGATLQLAKALDRAGRPDEALPVWRRMLEMAEAVGNAETAAVARARLEAAR